MKRLSAWERAFQLAESGRLANYDAVLHALKAEGYGAAAVRGRKLSYELNRLCSLSSSRSAA
jgi:hypothetical protein